MSFRLTRAFVQAIRKDSDLMKYIGGTVTGDRVYGERMWAVARSREEDEADKLPYIIVMPGTIQAEGSEDDYEQQDQCSISILLCTVKFSELVMMEERVRKAVREHLEDDETFSIESIGFSADVPQFDMSKPCYHVTLNYQVTTQSIS